MKVLLLLLLLLLSVAKDYVRLMKYGDSLYRCKQLKRAALGRMCTILKRQKSSLEYLEQGSVHWCTLTPSLVVTRSLFTANLLPSVRQHLSRLPTIDPNTRTLLLCGYPNVGKSSFINKVRWRLRAATVAPCDLRSLCVSLCRKVILPVVRVR